MCLSAVAKSDFARYNSAYDWENTVSYSVPRALAGTIARIAFARFSLKIRKFGLPVKNLSSRTSGRTRAPSPPTVFIVRIPSWLLSCLTNCHASWGYFVFELIFQVPPRSWQGRLPSGRFGKSTDFNLASFGSVIALSI